MCSVNEERETLTSAARRYGRSTTNIGAILSAAGVYRRERGNIGRGLQLLVADVDRAMQAAGATVRVPSTPATPTLREPPPDAANGCEAPARPADAHVPDAEGNVACGACWSIATLTRGRVIVCRWCKGAESWAA